LTGTYQRARYFHPAILAVMSADHAAVEVEQLRKTADLVTVPGRQDNRIAPSLQFPYHRKKEWDVWGIVQVNPYFLMIQSILLHHSSLVICKVPTG
jgi:hypothetical protein